MLLVGLGNPGAEYARTRHNVGFMVLDELLPRLGGRWSEGKRYAQARAHWCDRTMTFLKPLTYMNRSGGPTADRARFYKVPVDEIVVIHDEMDIPFGQIRLKAGGGVAGHNGLRSLVEHLGGGDFLRVRVGVDKPPRRQMGASYVLAPFDDAEAEGLGGVLDGAIEAIEALVADGLDAARNAIHGRDFAAA